MPADNCPRFLESDSVMCLARHVQSTQNKKFVISPQYLLVSTKTYYKLLKVSKSLQYFKKVSNEVHFLHADKHTMMVMARHVQSIHNKKLVIFLQHFNKKKDCNCFSCPTVMGSKCFRTGEKSKFSLAFE